MTPERHLQCLRSQRSIVYSTCSTDTGRYGKPFVANHKDYPPAADDRTRAGPAAGMANASPWAGKLRPATGLCRGRWGLWHKLRYLQYRYGA